MNWTLCLTALTLTLGGTTPELNDQTYEHWRDYILPKKAELSWQEIPWRASFWQGVLEAQKSEKPILLWAMNGHPLACT